MPSDGRRLRFEVCSSSSICGHSNVVFEHQRLLCDDVTWFTPSAGLYKRRPRPGGCACCKAKDRTRLGEKGDYMVAVSALSRGLAGRAASQLTKPVNLGVFLGNPRCPRWLIANNLKCTPGGAICCVRARSALGCGKRDFEILFVSACFWRLEGSLQGNRQATVPGAKYAPRQMLSHLVQ